MFPAAAATAAAASQDAAAPVPVAKTPYHTAVTNVATMKLDPFKIPTSLAQKLGMQNKTAPFVPAGIAKMSAYEIATLLQRSDLWVHRCAEMYTDFRAALRRERASLRMAGEFAQQLFFVQHLGHKPLFLMKNMSKSKIAGKIVDRTMVIAKEVQLEESSDIFRFTYVAEMWEEATQALQGLPHIKVSHPKEENVTAYDVFVPDEGAKMKLRAVGLLDEKAALTSTKYETTQVTLRAAHPVGEPLPKHFYELARKLPTAQAILKPSSLHLRFETPEAMMEAMGKIGSAYVKVYDVPPPRKSMKQTPAEWSPELIMPEPQFKTYAIKSVRARSDADFVEAAKMAKLEPVKLLSFYMMTVTFAEGELPRTIKLAELDPRFTGMVVEPIDLF